MFFLVLSSSCFASFGVSMSRSHTVSHNEWMTLSGMQAKNTVSFLGRHHILHYVYYSNITSVHVSLYYDWTCIMSLEWGYVILVDLTSNLYIYLCEFEQYTKKYNGPRKALSLFFNLTSGMHISRRSAFWIKASTYPLSHKTCKVISRIPLPNVSDSFVCLW